MAVNRLIGDSPVIGIRPTIDGRRPTVTPLIRLLSRAKNSKMSIENRAQKRKVGRL